ncbi:PI-PLC X domain-containing protein 1-like [Sphaeramia orbicularis]|uniref:PI-PLC X domain-containing protein 1-like n=1 Tax=Sphaeramia orbicularis TaxID=375764 RepID=UPI00117FDBBD|nr:PI-PLC X domain-containing protein 1-like [Sphaeramia orbicularis]
MATGENQTKEPTGSITATGDWMSNLPKGLQNIPLWKLTIPGSHDSMSYDLDINSSIIEPDILKHIGLRSVHKIVKEWATTQEVNIIQQLDAGVRFLDLRIARKKDDSDPTRVYFYHGLYTVTDVRSVLKDINGWAVAHPTEILILALSHFENFDNSLHDGLISSIKKIFGRKLVQKMPQQKLTLKRCWDDKTNVMVTYGDRAEVQKHPELWSNITYYYGDTMDPEVLKNKVYEDLTNATTDYFFICGLNLTLPDSLTALKYVAEYNSLRQYSLKYLKQLVVWAAGVQQAHKRRLNIVASDFVTQDNFVSTIIQLNTI